MSFRATPVPVFLRGASQKKSCPVSLWKMSSFPSVPVPPPSGILETISNVYVKPLRKAPSPKSLCVKPVGVKPPLCIKAPFP